MRSQQGPPYGTCEALKSQCSSSLQNEGPRARWEGMDNASNRRWRDGCSPPRIPPPPPSSLSPVEHALHLIGGLDLELGRAVADGHAAAAPAFQVEIRDGALHLSLLVHHRSTNSTGFIHDVCMQQTLLRPSKIHWTLSPPAAVFIVLDKRKTRKIK